MKIFKIDRQSRNDLYGILECEFCQEKQKFQGYDDDYYHNMVMSNIRCKSCGKNSNDVIGEKALKNG